MATKKTPEEIEISKKTRTRKATAAKKPSLKGKEITKRAAGKGNGPTDYVPDLSVFDWGEKEPTEKDKLFIYWYTTMGTPLWHNKTQCAKKVGSRANRNNLHGSGNVIYERNKDLINRIEKENRDTLLTNQNEKNIRNIIARCDFNVTDFYESGTYTDKMGNINTTIKLKRLENMSPEQLSCIDGIEFDNYGRPNFKLANREKAIDRVDSLIDALKGKNNNSDFDVSLTLEGIRDKLEAKVSIIQKHEELTKQATGIEESTGNEEL